MTLAVVMGEIGSMQRAGMSMRTLLLGEWKGRGLGKEVHNERT